MRKNKFIALALAAGMTFCNVAATGIIAYAADTTKSANNSTSNFDLKITNSGSTTHTFEIYQIFKGTLSEENGVKTLSDIEWGDGVNSNSGYAKDHEATAAANEISTVADAEKFADDINSSLSNPTMSVDVDAGKDTTVSLPAGYYLVKDKDSTQTGDNAAYTQFLLRVVGDAEATTKLDAPSSLKKVKENNSLNTEKAEDEDARISGFAVGVQYNDVADYSIGEAIPYELVGTLPSNYDKYETYKYEFVDTMSAGLTLNQSEDKIKVYVKASKDAVKEDDITSAATITKDDHNLKVSFNDLKKAYPSATKDSVFVVRYEASLNSNAVIGLNGNDNTFHLVYSNNPNKGGEGSTGETPDDKNIVFTYELDNTKITYISAEDYTKLNDTDKTAYAEASYDLDSNGTAETVYKKVLSGAKFKLYDADNGGKGAVVTDGKFVEWTTDATKVTELVSGTDGLVKIAGLDEGTYYLEETAAPTGYNKLTKRVKIAIEATTANNQNWNEQAEDALTALSVKLNDGAALAGNATSGIVSTEIVNMPGAVLPSTGGMGTTILYVIGGILVIGGGVAIFIKRKKDAE